MTRLSEAAAHPPSPPHSRRVEAGTQENAGATRAAAPPAAKWELYRQDIHGREVGMAVFDSEAEAEAAAAVYTARGHHQVA